jgi:hypothetical protein
MEMLGYALFCFDRNHDEQSSLVPTIEVGSEHSTRDVVVLDSYRQVIVAALVEFAVNLSGVRLDDDRGAHKQ